MSHSKKQLQLNRWTFKIQDLAQHTMYDSSIEPIALAESMPKIHAIHEKCFFPAFLKFLLAFSEMHP
jgi:hypothetical protein